jgi:opacity protein-like surface antigen
MPKKYLLSIPFLLAAGIAVAHAEQNTDPTTAAVQDDATVKTGAKAKAGTKAKVAKKAAVPAPANSIAPETATTTPVGKESTEVLAAPANPANPANTVLADQPMFKFGGFGTLGASHSSMNLGDYVIDSDMPKGAGLSNNWAASNNVRVTAHVTADLTPKVSAILQVDSEYRADATYRPEVEWFNVKYALTPNAYMRVGRIALPTFMDSENRDVGYSYAWVNAPVDLYHQLSIPSSDGVDFVYRSEIGETGNTVKAIYGTNTEKSPHSESTSKDLWGVFDTIEYGPTTLHLSYQQRRSSTLNLQTGISSAWNISRDLSVGASYDPGNWFVISEWIQHRTTIKVDAMYVSGGYRINKFTPYLLYSQNSPGSFLPGSPPPSAAAIERANRAQTTTGVGVRWDFMRNWDFKIQYDQVKLSDNSNGYLINVPTGVTLYGSKFHVISVVVDFVF